MGSLEKPRTTMIGETLVLKLHKITVFSFSAGMPDNFSNHLHQEEFSAEVKKRERLQTKRHDKKLTLRERV